MPARVLSIRTDSSPDAQVSSPGQRCAGCRLFGLARLLVWPLVLAGIAAFTVCERVAKRHGSLTHY